MLSHVSLLSLDEHLEWPPGTGATRIDPIGAFALNVANQLLPPQRTVAVGHACCRIEYASRGVSARWVMPIGRDFAQG